jgi:hypothetical protein
MAAPSSLPSANELTQECAVRYQAKFGMPIPEEHAGNLNAMAKFFFDNHELVQVFIYQVVNWSRFRRNPNPGHLALADFLESKAAVAVITTNYDCLIERGAEYLGDADFEAVIDGREVNLPREHSPLLKTHGCWQKDRKNTIWCAEQLAHSPVKERVEHSVTWMKAALPQRDIVVIGFWSDWPHLANVLEAVVSDIEPRMAVIVDLQTPEQLREKAPALWDWVNQPNVDFAHLQMSAADFLDELRRSYSEVMLNKLLADARPVYEGYLGPLANTPQMSLGLSAEDLYQFRRSLSGIPTTQPVKVKRHDASMRLAGAAVILLKLHGATEDSGAFRLHGERIRVIRGTDMLSAERARFDGEPPDPIGYDLTICGGAHEDGGVPAHLVRSGDIVGIVRSRPKEDWVTLQQAFNRFGPP